MSGLFEKLQILYYFICARFRFGFRTRFQSRMQLEAWQHKRLKKHLKFVIKNSIFYKQHVANDFNKTTPIDKKIMMTNFNQLNTRGLDRDQALAIALKSESSRDFSPMIKDITVGLSSGTSGHRGIFCADGYERRFYAGTILAKALPKGSLFKKNRVAFFLRANSNLYRSTESSRIEFNYFDLLLPFEDHLEKLKVVQPTLLIGPPSLLRQVAEAILNEKLSLPGVKRIFSVAEVLDPVDEMQIQKAFKQKVHQIYQCTEGFLGISCEMGSLHLNEELLIIEKEWVDKEHGKFVPIVTDLYRRTQPIIRYRLNDILTEDPEPCACGSVMTRLKMIEGRCDDMIDFLQGEKQFAVYPDFIRNAILFASDEIVQYRLTQTPSGDLVVALETTGKIEDLENKVRHQLQILANRLNCQLPLLIFSHEFPELKGNKLRRIMRQSAIDHLP